MLPADRHRAFCTSLWSLARLLLSSSISPFAPPFPDILYPGQKPETQLKQCCMTDRQDLADASVAPGPILVHDDLIRHLKDSHA